MMSMLPPDPHKFIIRSALAFALVLKVFDLLTLPAFAANSDPSALHLQDLQALGQSAIAGPVNTSNCPPILGVQANLPTRIASSRPNALHLAQGLPGDSCPADFTAVPCGTGEEGLFCEVGGVTPDSVGGGLLAPLAPLAAAAGGGFPIAALAPLAAAPLAAFAGGSGGGSSDPTPPASNPEPIPEPSMIPAAALAMGFIYWQRRRRTPPSGKTVSKA